MSLDRFDKKIVALLVDDARISVSEVSKKVNLSRSAVTERIKRLETNQVITGYHAHLNTSQESHVSAYFSLTFSPLCCDQIEALLLEVPEVKLAHSISGDVDLIVFVEAAHMARLNAIRTMMDSWPNLQKIITHMVLTDRVHRL